MTVSIIGFGWLGKALHLELQSKKIKNNTFSRSISDINDFFLFDLHQDIIPKEKLGDVVIFTIPPSSVHTNLSNFKKFVKLVSKDSHLIYISSTSVFAEDQGVCYEETTPLSQSTRGLRQRELELIIEQRGEAYTIIRSGGQIGGGRFPRMSEEKKHTLSGKINLIDQCDLVSILIHLISTENKPKLIHAVAAYHPEKQMYYFGKKRTNEKTSEEERKPKIIESRYLPNNYKFKNPKLEHSLLTRESV